MDKKNADKIVATTMADVGTPTEVQCVGHLMREFFKTVVDADTHVDHGAGPNSYDLWGTVNGVEIYINVKKSLHQIAKDTP